MGSDAMRVRLHLRRADGDVITVVLALQAPEVMSDRPA